MDPALRQRVSIQWQRKRCHAAATCVAVAAAFACGWHSVGTESGRAIPGRVPDYTSTARSATLRLFFKQGPQAFSSHCLWTGAFQGSVVHLVLRRAWLLLMKDGFVNKRLPQKRKLLPSLVV
jgi:hypothetical protein